MAAMVAMGTIVALSIIPITRIMVIIVPSSAKTDDYKNHNKMRRAALWWLWRVLILMDTMGEPAASPYGNYNANFHTIGGL
jgi:hypothetical protein